LTLLTAFSPKLLIARAGDNVYTGKSGGTTWTILVGGGTAHGLRSDGHLVLAAHDEKTKTTELLRFGGSHLEFNGIDVPGNATDVFGTIKQGKLIKALSTNG
jgi:hypothetical protein